MKGQTHEFYTFGELESRPLLQEIKWTKRLMASLAKMGYLEAHIDPATGEYLTTIKSVKVAIELRNEALRRRAVDPDLLDET